MGLLPHFFFSIGISKKKLSELTQCAALVFTVYLPAMKSRMEYFWKLLSTHEIIKVGNFSSPILKERHVISHGILRVLLSFYCQISPKAILFEYNCYGKPYLLNKPRVQFNLSHSQDFAAYVIALEHEVGIDIEWQNSSINIDGLAEQVLSPFEMKQFSYLSLAEKTHTFYDIWTKKEAIIKAMGKGLSYPLKAIETISSLPLPGYHIEKNDKFYCVSFSSFKNVTGAIAIKNNLPEFIQREIYHPSELDSFTHRTPCKVSVKEDLSLA